MDDASSQTCCPFVDTNDPRCGSRFSVTRLEQAFTVCFGSYRHCPMFRRISAMPLAGQPARPARSALIEVTAHGSSLPLRATGT